jgi:hypothetical protein
MPLYISNTNRVETLQGASGRGINSTTTTTLAPPAVSFWWAKTGDFQSGSFGGDWFQTTGATSWTVSGPGKWFGGALAINWDFDNPPPLVSNNFGITPYGGVDKSNTISIWRSPFSSSFEVTPSIFGKVTTFTNTFTTASGQWMLASYVAWSGSNITYEFVPPSSSIQRCVTYPYLANFAAPMSGGYGDTSYIAPLDASAFGADCEYDTYCECIYCYQGDAYIGGPTLISGSAPCNGGTTTTTTTTSTTTTTTTSTTTTTTTTAPASSSYQVEYLIVAGGGAGGPATATGLTGTGGGGAGGYISGSLFVTASQSYSFVVGDGGSGNDPDYLIGNPGQNSTAFGFTAISGSGGASQSGDAYLTGGSGGGGASRGSSSPARLPASGSAPQGNNGGVGLQAVNGAGGGGGGALTAGSTPGTNTYGGGGLGKLWLDGTTYAAGGNAMGTGTTTQAAVNGTANTGNGGGGIKTNTTVTNGGAGGSGIVAVRYVSGSASATGGTIVNAGGYTYHYFTGSGTFTA